MGWSGCLPNLYRLKITLGVRGSVNLEFYLHELTVDSSYVRLFTLRWPKKTLGTWSQTLRAFFPRRLFIMWRLHHARMQEYL
jgi:hypothetical protein